VASLASFLTHFSAPHQSLKFRPTIFRRTTKLPTAAYRGDAKPVLHYITVFSVTHITLNIGLCPYVNKRNMGRVTNELLMLEVWTKEKSNFKMGLLEIDCKNFVYVISTCVWVVRQYVLFTLKEESTTQVRKHKVLRKNIWTWREKWNWIIEKYNEKLNFLCSFPDTVKQVEARVLWWCLKRQKQDMHSVLEGHFSLLKPRSGWESKIKIYFRNK
jgi:hypothetical protein